MRRLTAVTAIPVLAVTVAVIASGCSTSPNLVPGGVSPSVSAVSSSESASASPSASSSTVELTPDVQASLQKVLDDVRVKFKAPGVQAGVWTDTQQWVGTSGVAKVGTTQPITAADHTRIGSITKTMTATVILQLVDEGKLKLTDVIDSYVPGMPNGSTATIKNLLEMQSGIPSYTADPVVLNRYAADPTTTFTPQELVDSVKKTPPMFAPGTSMFYSNTNYVLLGMVIEKVTGKSVAQNFQERLFTPLGMSQTSMPGGSTQLPEPFLSGISTQTNPEGTIKNATNWNPSLAFTAGEAISTLDDLHKWTVALGTGAGILSPSTQQMRVDSVKEVVGVGANEAMYSYGLGLVNLGGWLGHTGEIPGYNTIVNYDPATRTTVVVMVNSDITIDAKPKPLAPAVAAFTGIASALTGGATPSATPTTS